MGTQAIEAQTLQIGGAMPTRRGRAVPELERIPITKARSMIGQLLNRVHIDKDRILLEKSGIPVAVLIDVEEYNRFLAFQKRNDPERAA